MAASIKGVIAHQIRRGFAALPPVVQHRLRRMRFWTQTHSAPQVARPQRAVVVPGNGPVVLINALGIPWSAVVELVGRRGGRRERLVVVTDQSQMHVARDLAVVVEFVPDFATPDGDDSRLDERFEELVKAYGVEAVVAPGGVESPPSRGASEPVR